MNWCLGLMFNNNKDEILLLRKKRGPSFLIDKWNGLGGKIEKDESGNEAIEREIKEEAGLSITDWKFVCLLKTSTGDIYIYTVSTGEIYWKQQIEDEHLEIFKLKDLPYINTVPNLKWLIPMSLNILNGSENCQAFKVEEIY